MSHTCQTNENDCFAATSTSSEQSLHSTLCDIAKRSLSSHKTMRAAEVQWVQQYNYNSTTVQLQYNYNRNSKYNSTTTTETDIITMGCCELWVQTAKMPEHFTQPSIACMSPNSKNVGLFSPDIVPWKTNANAKQKMGLACIPATTRVTEMKSHIMFFSLIIS